MSGSEKPYPLLNSYIKVPRCNERVIQENACDEEFKIIGDLGKGSVGTVYLGQSCERDFKIAIKVIHLKNDEFFKRALNEVDIQKKALHPHILRLYSSYREKDNFFLILEFSEGGSFKNYLKSQPNGKLSEFYARDFLRQIVDGLLFLHSHENVVHRDISLGNLLLTEELKIKIADFGFASKLTNSRDKLTSKCGTYIAPEINGTQPYSFEVDVWSVGCVFHHMITGKPYLPEEPLKLASDTSPMARNLLSKMLKNDPKQRINLSEVLLHPFFANYLKYNPDHQLLSAVDSGIEPNSSPVSSLNMHIRHTRRKETSTPTNANCRHKNVNINSPIKKSCPVRNFLSRSNLPLQTEENNEKKYYIAPVDTYSRSGQISIQSLPNLKNISSPSLKDSGMECFNSPNNSSNDRFRSPLRSKASPINNILKPSRYSDDQNYQNCSKDSNCTMNQKQKMENLPPRRLVEAQRNQFNREDTHSHQKRYVSADPIDNCRQNTLFPESKKHLSKSNSKNNRERPDGPICTTRIPPQEHRIKNKFVKILDTGKVLVELTTDREEMFDCCTISSDGKKIVVFERYKEREINHGIFSFENLPSNHFRKYHLASAVCNVMRSRTPKITYYHPLATFKLMENKDFKGEFYSKESILFTGKQYQFTDADGKITVANGKTVNIANLSTNIKQLLLDTFLKCYDVCIETEKNISNIDIGLFPLICGRKVKKTAISTNINNKENVYLGRRHI